MLGLIDNVNKYARISAGAAYMRVKDDFYLALNCVGEER
jgi:hypothetical protein